MVGKKDAGLVEEQHEGIGDGCEGEHIAPQA